MSPQDSNQDKIADSLKETIDSIPDKIVKANQSYRAGQSVPVQLGGQLGGNRGIVRAIAKTKIEGGSDFAVVRKNNGDRFAIQGNQNQTVIQQTVINDRWKMPQAEQLFIFKPGNLKVLFAKQTDNIVEFFVGGHVETPIKIYELDLNDFNDYRSIDVAGLNRIYNNESTPNEEWINRGFYLSENIRTWSSFDWTKHNIFYLRINSFPNYYYDVSGLGYDFGGGAAASPKSAQGKITNTGVGIYDFIVSLSFFSMKTVIIKGDESKKDSLNIAEYNFPHENNPYFDQMSDEHLFKLCSQDIGNGIMLNCANSMSQYSSYGYQSMWSTGGFNFNGVASALQLQGDFSLNPFVAPNTYRPNATPAPRKLNLYAISIDQQKKEEKVTQGLAFDEKYNILPYPIIFQSNYTTNQNHYWHYQQPLLIGQNSCIYFDSKVQRDDNNFNALFKYIVKPINGNEGTIFYQEELNNENGSSKGLLERNFNAENVETGLGLLFLKYSLGSSVGSIYGSYYSNGVLNNFNNSLSCVFFNRPTIESVNLWFDRGIGTLFLEEVIGLNKSNLIGDILYKECCLFEESVINHRSQSFPDTDYSLLDPERIPLESANYRNKKSVTRIWSFDLKSQKRLPDIDINVFSLNLPDEENTYFNIIIDSSYHP